MNALIRGKPAQLFSTNNLELCLLVSFLLSFANLYSVGIISSLLCIISSLALSIRWTKSYFLIASAFGFVCIAIQIYAFAWLAINYIDPSYFDPLYLSRGQFSFSYFSNGAPFLSASNIITCFNSVFFGSLSLFLKASPRKYFFSAFLHIGTSPPKLNNYLLSSIALLVLTSLLSIRGPLIFGVGYHSATYKEAAGQQSQVLQALSILFMFASIYFLFVGWRFKQLFAFRYTALLLLVSFFRLFRGERQSMLIFFLISSFMFFYSSKSKYKLLYLIASLVLIYLFLDFWASFRWNIGLNLSLIDALRLSINQNSLSAINLWDINRLNIAYFNFLWVSDLIDRGIYLEGSSYSSLFTQLVPSFIANSIGLQRELSGSWVLSEYFQHGGAFFSPAEMYWNYGTFSLTFFSIYLAFFIKFVEKIHRKYLFLHLRSNPSLSLVLFSATYLPALATITGFIAGFVQLVKLQIFYLLIVYIWRNLVLKFNIRSS